MYSLGAHLVKFIYGRQSSGLAKLFQSILNFKDIITICVDISKETKFSYQENITREVKTPQFVIFLLCLKNTR